jgi:hypothetical protein
MRSTTVRILLSSRSMIWTYNREACLDVHFLPWVHHLYAHVMRYLDTASHIRRAEYPKGQDCFYFVGFNATSFSPVRSADAERSAMDSTSVGRSSVIPVIGVEMMQWSVNNASTRIFLVWLSFTEGKSEEGVTTYDQI